ncbi:DNA mismatch repair protein Msh6 [Planococcus citri]|uniref:DNA mismatch repair protein Msh6 n=1 Tax=Planococcus citri TaxID=170843 RepID=UPI0031F7B31A
MSQKTLFNYFTKSPAVSKKENGVQNGISTPPSSKTPESKKVESSKKVNGKADSKTPKSSKKSKTDVETPTSSRKVNGKAGSKTPKSSKKDKTELDTPASSKKRARQNSLGKFSSTPVSKKLKTEEDDAKNEPDIEESPETPPMKKRRRILEELSSEDCDSGDEYVPDKKEESEDESEVSEHESDESPIQTESDDDDDSPKKTKTKKQNGKAPKMFNSSFSSDRPKIPLSATAKELGDENWPHLKLEFLKPEKIRDAKRRPKDDPNYDPKTLLVPEDYKNKLTPGVRQWWELKSQNFDIILFFKVGKFYELYHMDAVIAANELNLTFMKGDFAHVGFPEKAYCRFSATLIEKGYKIARVEQTETPDMMAERCKKTKPTRFDKVVKREICQITSRGTRTFGILEGETKEAESNFLLAIAEKEIDHVSSSYGVCFVDTSIGLFHVGQFVDDRHSSRLRTLMAHYPPVQVLCEKNHLTARTNHVLNTALSGAVKDQLQSDSEFWSASRTLVKLIENYYKDNKLPKELNDFLGEDGSVNMICSDESELGVRALGAVVWCLQRCLIDYKILTMGRFSVYEPIDLESPAKILDNQKIIDSFNKHMVLDAVTLKNLDVLENSMGGVHGSLLHKLDNCCTPFGKRLLQRWICSPLANIQNIKARQDAIHFLRECSVSQEVRSIMSQLPDLERLLSKIHSQGTDGIQENHPETRAILFEEKIYSKRKIIDFISAINGFKTAVKIINLFTNIDTDEMPPLIRQCCRSANESEYGRFPDLTNALDFFENAFDANEAQKEGRIMPNPGTDSDYDEAMDNLKSIENETKDYLKKQSAYFGCKVGFFGSDKRRFQLEIPDSACKRAKEGYELVSQRKGYKRYHTPETREFYDRIVAAEEQKINVLKNLAERIFSRFSGRFEEWNAALQCLSVLDVLLSFAEYCKNENETCVPEFVPIAVDDQPFVKLIDGHYPCSTGDDVFIPNSTLVGVDDAEKRNATLLLVTGPNMGGKSTLMRQLGLIVIMAHMGCHVPAVQLKLTLVDRVFTRLGANDDIMAGESTFYVELCETSSILQHASKHSLVLIDELGRGTSTYDGTAIASAVLNELCNVKCRTLFSTHYHSLVEYFKNNENVALGHMSCMVENEAEDDAEGSEETVTFLYKFAQGACPKSYGFNAARLAGMPKHITQVGSRRAKQLENEVHKRRSFKKLFQSELDSVQELIAAL